MPCRYFAGIFHPAANSVANDPEVAATKWDEFFDAHQVLSVPSFGLIASTIITCADRDACDDSDGGAGLVGVLTRMRE